jgi:hypothetical protein
MRENRDSIPYRPGYTLPAVLMLVAALFLLVVGSLAVSVGDRRATRRGTDRERAALAARAGLAEVRGLLEKEAANDDFLVTGAKSTPHLFLVRPEGTDGGFSFRYRPLFSTTRPPADQTALTAPEVEEPDEGKLSLRPFAQEPVKVEWLSIQDREGKSVARYAFWVEDLQGRLDAKSAGNRRGPGESHQRPAWPFPASLNPAPSKQTNDRDAEPTLDVVALHALPPEPEPGDWDRKIMENRKLLVSPGSVLAAAEQPLPLKRDADGRLENPLARILEENLAANLRPYDEQPRVPFVKGIASTVAGQPKRNLNACLGEGKGSVEKTAGWVRQALPEFESRQGGFPEQYLETLVANAIDYADANSDATVEENRYRGLDACPVVSEFVMRFRWENVVQENGRKFLVLSASTYAELWNPTDQPVHGRAELSFETNFTFAAGANPAMSLGDAGWLRDRSVTTSEPPLIERDGGFVFAFDVPQLRPNEYKLIKAGQVTYKIDVGPDSFFIPSPLVLTGDDGVSGYKLWWNDTRVDRARGKLRRSDATLHYPSDTKAKPRQKQRANVPGLTHKRGAANYCNNPGDPRITAYLQAPQDANDYPDNYSPNRRNVRWGNIYAVDLSTKPKHYGRVLPSEWPDGGHDADYGNVPPAVLAGEGGKEGDERVMPDDPQFFQNLSEPKAEQAPMRISNRGRFYSATELGRIYDPVMWNTGAPPGAGEPWPDVTDSSLASGDFGGGNTLRIGRPEHPRFDRPGMRATRLLDLFHAGKSRSDDASQREGALVRIEGHVNLNTARRDVIRALAAGALRMDPLLAKRTSLTHDTMARLAPPVSPLELSAPMQEHEADRIAEAIMKGRPFASLSEIAALKDEQGRFVFGNREVYPEGTSIQWSDAAAEEVFARVYEASTARSRNFRVWVIGQSLGAPKSDGSPVVLAECRKVFSVFADPGERNPDGSIDPKKTRAVILDENDF